METNPYASIHEAETPSNGHPVYIANPTSDAIIPYKNPKALIAYYLGILSGLPLIGLPIGIAAFVLGIQGLQNRRKDPNVKGSIHAWIGIGCGGFFAVFWFLMILFVFVGALFAAVD